MAPAQRPNILWYRETECNVVLHLLEKAGDTDMESFWTKPDACLLLSVCQLCQELFD